MKTNFVSIFNVVNDWIEDSGLSHDEVKEGVLIKWATDALNMMNLMEQTRHKVSLLRVENSRVELPLDFKVLLQASANVKDNNFVKTTREQIIQWVHGTYEKDCHLEINLICDKCHRPTESCGCGELKEHQPIVIDVDRTWEMAHPEIYYKSYQRIGRFGYGPQPGSMYSPKFELMRYATQDYHKVNLILGDCPNVNCRDCVRTFRIELPYLEVDFNSGEVLISYLGRVVDENLNPMIPDHPDVLEAIQNHLDYKYFGRIWKKNDNQLARAKSQEALQLREINMGIAKSVLDTPEYKEFTAWFNTQFYKRMPNPNHDANMNKHVRDDYEKYGDIMKY